MKSKAPRLHALLQHDPSNPVLAMVKDCWAKLNVDSIESVEIEITEKPMVNI